MADGYQMTAGTDTEKPDDFEQLLAAISLRQPDYDKAILAPADPSIPASPESLCRALLERVSAEPACGGTAGVSEFLAWAVARQPPRVLFAMAATFAADQQDWDRAFAWSKRAMAMEQRDTYAQRLNVLARARKGDRSAEFYEDLSERFCHRPWQEFELRSNGDVHTCCSAWLPVPIGNIQRQTADEIWNSPTAQEIRRSVLDGDYRHCSRVHCPAIVRGRLPRRDEVRDPEHRRIIDERLTVFDRKPVRVVMSQDRSCNLSCPSCRTKMIVAGKDEQDRLNELAERVIFPLIAEARQVKVTGSGDPFGSGHFRYLLKRINRREFPNLRLQLQTNGVLLDEKAWTELELEGLVESIWVSIDAGRPETYAIVRRGGSWDRLMSNLAFMGRLLREGRVDVIQLDYVVQGRNFRELPLAAAIAREHGLSRMSIQMIRNWGTFSAEEFASHFIGAPDHPDYAEFLEVLRHPDVQPPFVDYSNMRNYWEQAQRR